MNTLEFSQRFDTFLNSNKDYGQYGLTQSNIIKLNEYEKSMFLTTAQEEIVLNLVSGRNQTGDSFEKNEEVRRYLQPLLFTEEISSQVTSEGSISSYSQFFSLEDLTNEDVWKIVYEHAKIGNGNRVTEVKPKSHSEILDTLNNPFKCQFLKRTFRLDVNDYGDKLVELINSYQIKSYTIRYLKRPNPIVLEDFENVSINGVKIKTECELHESLHSTILLRAYEMALQAYAVAHGMVPQQKDQKESNNK